MIKKEYQKPTMKVVQLQQRTMILAGSGGGPVRSVNAGDTGIGIDENDEPAGDGFWGR